MKNYLLLNLSFNTCAGFQLNYLVILTSFELECILISKEYNIISWCKHWSITERKYKG